MEFLDHAGTLGSKGVQVLCPPVGTVAARQIAKKIDNKSVSCEVVFLVRRIIHLLQFRKVLLSRHELTR